MTTDLSTFTTEYYSRKSRLDAGASLLEEYLKQVLENSRILFHGTQARVKDLDSAIRKIGKKSYERPWESLTDVVGVRIFLYFRQDTPLAEVALRRHFDVDDTNSPNKADSLDVNQFGYTSRHLVCRVDHRTEDLRLRTRLEGIWFEIQIRTVLEHAWAEIEHELVYKAKTKVPLAVRRRFAASAASLELIDREFTQLRRFEIELVNERLNILNSSHAEQLDRAWLVAVLLSAFPGRATWDPDPVKDTFYGGVEVHVLDFLSERGVRNVGDWVAAVGANATQKAVLAYGAAKNRPDKDVSHLAIALVACLVLVGGSPLPSQLRRYVDVELGDAVLVALGLGCNDDVDRIGSDGAPGTDQFSESVDGTE